MQLVSKLCVYKGKAERRRRQPGLKGCRDKLRGYQQGNRAHALLAHTLQRGNTRSRVPNKNYLKEVSSIRST